MSSEAAKKAYPEPDWLDSFEAQTERVGKRVAFDRGAVEALRQAAAELDKVLSSDSDHCDCGNPRVDWERIDRAFEWEAGQ